VTVKRIIWSLLAVDLTEQKPTILTFVAVDVKTSIKCHNTHGLRFTGLGHDTQTTHVAFGGEFVVKILDAVDLICCIDSKWNSVERFATNDADEAGRMVWLPSGAEDPIRDWF